MKRLLTLSITILVGIAIGAFSYRLWDIRTATNRHWRNVHAYREFIFNAENYRPDPNTGFSVATPPGSIEPSLAALVDAGELQYVDIVLPTVPYSNRAATLHWMAFCERHKEDIVWTYGIPSTSAFRITGEQPLHLQFWYPEKSTALIQQLIDEIENLEKRD